MDPSEQVKALALSSGASLVGVANVERFSGAPTGHHPGELLPGARSVVTFGIRLLRRVSEWPDLLQGSPLIPEETRVEALRALFYKRSGYDIINDRLNQVALTLANYLEDQGQPSLFFPATYGYSPEWNRPGVLPGMLSQRHAAARAGLGEFGLNNVVVTERYGPRVRWNSVLTTAVLEPTPLLASKVCLGEACRLCVDECPAGALTVGPSQSAAVWLDPVSRTDWPQCQHSQRHSDCMGHCLRVCPLGS
ncbi:MAG: 4Fe-4S binding protein [Chloroflexota bacterium]